MEEYNLGQGQGQRQCTLQSATRCSIHALQLSYKELFENSKRHNLHYNIERIIYTVTFHSEI